MHAPTIRSNVVDFLELAEKATARLQASPYLAVRRLWCELEQGILLLRGDVDSFYLKQVAQEAVASVKGTTRLVNEIIVARATGSDGAENFPNVELEARKNRAPDRRSEPSWC